jgi:hypothetical protein
MKKEISCLGNIQGVSAKQVAIKGARVLALQNNTMEESRDNLIL